MVTQNARRRAAHRARTSCGRRAIYDLRFTIYDLRLITAHYVLRFTFYACISTNRVELLGLKRVLGERHAAATRQHPSIAVRVMFQVRPNSTCRITERCFRNQDAPCW
jgi:hypothetical protein